MHVLKIGEKRQLISLYLSACPSVRLSVRPPILPSACPSVRPPVGPSVRMEQPGSHWTDFYEI